MIAGRILFAFLLGANLVWCNGCNEANTTPPLTADAAPVTATSAKVFASGTVVELGTPSLTAGIPGEGVLTIADIDAWLARPSNHEPLQVTLPPHLRDSGFDVDVPADNPLTRAKIELGRQLFFDGRFSASQALACGDCHHPKKAYTNFIGKYGELRDPLPNFNRILGKTHFWDGRANSLEQQVRTPVESPHEMKTSGEAIVGKLKASPGYRRQFEAIFGEVSFEAYSKALASFERTLVTSPSPWDRAQAGESDVPSAAAERGSVLFFSERTACSKCHTGSNFSDEAFHNVGSGGGVRVDAGRFNVTHLESDRGAFRTPTLRNVARTGPYFHDARFESLAEVVDYFNSGGHQATPSSSLEIAPLGLSPEEARDLIAFLEALSSDLPIVETGRLPE